MTRRQTSGVNAGLHAGVSSVAHTTVLMIKGELRFYLKGLKIISPRCHVALPQFDFFVETF